MPHSVLQYFIHARIELTEHELSIQVGTIAKQSEDMFCEEKKCHSRILLLQLTKNFYLLEY